MGGRARRLVKAAGGHPRYCGPCAPRHFRLSGVERHPRNRAILPLCSTFGASKRWLGTNADGTARTLSTADYYKVGRNRSQLAGRE